MQGGCGVVPHPPCFCFLPFPGLVPGEGGAFLPEKTPGRGGRGRLPGLLHGRLPQKRGAYASVFRRPARQAPVRLEGTCVISQGVPAATMVPPSLPPPGPMSTM